MMLTTMQSKRQSDQGFTLMEILVATVAFALIISALRTVFFNALDLRDRAFDSIDESAPKSIAADIIRRDFSGLIISGGDLAFELVSESVNSAVTPSDQVRFFTNTGYTAELLPWGDLQQVYYYLGNTLRQTNGVGQDLIRGINRNLLASIENPLEEQHLLEGVESFLCEFYDDETQTWLQTWDSSVEESQLPTAVRVSIDFVQPEIEENKKRRLPLELIIPVQTRPGEFPSENEEEEEGEEDQENSDQENNQGDGNAGGNNDAGGGNAGGDTGGGRS